MVEQEECAGLEVEVFCAGDGDAEPGAAEEAEEGSEEGPDEVAFEVWLGWGWGVGIGHGWVGGGSWEMGGAGVWMDVDICGTVMVRGRWDFGWDWEKRRASAVALLRNGWIWGGIGWKSGLSGGKVWGTGVRRVFVFGAVLVQQKVWRYAFFFGE